jgi:hypothetical protein
MSRMPEYQQVDKTGLASIRSLAAARASMLREIATRQHAVMSGFGGHPQVWTCQIDGTTSAQTSNFLARIPPGVTRAQVAVLEAGVTAGNIDVYTSTDTGGVRLWSARNQIGTRATARWNFGSNAENTFALTNRLLILEGAATETWRTVSGTITVDGVEVLAMGLIYLHRAR